MPNFIVQLPESATVSNMSEAARTMIIFAADADAARRAAAGRFEGDGNALWNDVATVTELVVGADLSDAGIKGWTLYARISVGAALTVDPTIFEVDGQTKNQAQGVLGNTRLHISDNIVVDGGGTGYADDDIVTFVGGTFSRVATCRVTGETAGVIDTVELVDPGEYTVLPASLLAVGDDSGTAGDDATFDLEQAEVGGYEALLAQMVTDMALNADFTTVLDMSENALGTRLFTLSDIGDDIGDSIVEFEMRHNGTEETVLMSTIVDDGIAGAVLTVALPALPLAPPRIHVFK